MNDVSTVRGVVHGRTIELEHDAGLPDGQNVVIIMRPLEAHASVGEGLKQSFGGWSDDPEGLDEYVEWSRQQRQQSRSGNDS